MFIEMCQGFFNCYLQIIYVFIYILLGKKYLIYIQPVIFFQGRINIIIITIESIYMIGTD